MSAYLNQSALGRDFGDGVEHDRRSPLLRHDDEERLQSSSNKTSMRRECDKRTIPSERKRRFSLAYYPFRSKCHTTLKSNRTRSDAFMRRQPRMRSKFVLSECAGECLSLSHMRLCQKNMPPDHVNKTLFRTLLRRHLAFILSS